MFTNGSGLLISGSRGLNDYKLFSEKLDYLLSNVQQWDIHLIVGDDRGVDVMAQRYAEENGLEIHKFYALWDEHGKSAGFVRNKSMFKFLLDNFQHLGVFAMWDGQSKGTAHAIRLANFYGMPLRICNPCKKVAVEEPQKPEEPVFVPAPKWFQDDPNLSNYDKFLVKSYFSNLQQDVNTEIKRYATKEEREAKRKRKQLLRRAAFFADMYGVWATPSWYEG